MRWRQAAWHTTGPSAVYFLARGLRQKNPITHRFPSLLAYTHPSRLAKGLGFPLSSAGKESACNAGDPGSVLGSGRSPGEGKGHPLQYSGLENSMDCILRGVTKSRTRLSNLQLHSCPRERLSLHPLPQKWLTSCGAWVSLPLNMLACSRKRDSTVSPALADSSPGRHPGSH